MHELVGVQRLVPDDACSPPATRVPRTSSLYKFADDDDAADVQQFSAGFILELTPERVGLASQLHIGRVLECSAQVCVRFPHARGHDLVPGRRDARCQSARTPRAQASPRCSAHHTQPSPPRRPRTPSGGVAHREPRFTTPSILFTKRSALLPAPTLVFSQPHAI